MDEQEAALVADVVDKARAFVGWMDSQKDRATLERELDAAVQALDDYREAHHRSRSTWNASA
jgi:hypothetical protein